MVFSKNKKIKKNGPRKTNRKPIKLPKPLATALKPLISIGGYFKGSWQELRQVRWPNRRATWGLTFAVILFSMFFVVLIILLDAMFKQLFELILK